MIIAQTPASRFIVDNVGLEAFANEGPSTPNTDNDHSPAIRPLWKKRVVLWGILALIINLAIILRSVLGLKHNGLKKESSTSSTTSSFPSLHITPTTLPNKPLERNVAALSFASDNALLQPVSITHLYFQNN